MAKQELPESLSSAERNALGALKPEIGHVRSSGLITHFMQHGALQSYVADATVAAKRSALEKSRPGEMSRPGMGEGVQGAFEKLQDVAQFFFQKLDKSFEYAIPSQLIAYLAVPLPGRDSGKMYNTEYQPSDLPASITFMGQFIDHDLTKNAMHLLDPQDGNVPDVASPYIDLDSVYGPRSDDNPNDPANQGGAASPRESDGRFKLRKLDDSFNAYDVIRENNVAQIEDGRNDENQLILQVHLLIMRVHNLLISQKKMTAEQAQRETIFNWQSVVLNDHQASVLDPKIREEVLEDLRQEASKPGSGPDRLKYRPQNKALKLPHEFAIAFRYGHSQLRDVYYLSESRFFTLFDNLQPGPNFTDLRGNRPLTVDHVIDWPYFIDPADENRKSNQLDTKIASDVFNLPESAVPDGSSKFLGNLPQRNLIRSREIGLTSGEKLFDFYFGAGAPGKLTPDEIEPDKSKQALFELQAGAGFQTPLWYYVLKEAELNKGLEGRRLGKLGSRLVGEVVGGAIYYNPVSFTNEPEWKSAITDSNVVTMKELVKFVTDKDATAPSWPD
jgi:hypothetical protein